MKKGNNITFHGTFPPVSIYLSRLLEAADGKAHTKEELSSLTGVPQGKSSGKVLPHINYLIFMGLLNKNGTSYTRTPLGECVYINNGDLEDVLTQWLLHIRLTSCSGAEMWNYVIRELLPSSGGHITDTYYKQQMAVRFGGSKRFSPVATSYSNALKAIQYLTYSPKPSKSFKGGMCVNQQQIHKEYCYLYAYALLHEWDLLYPAENEITEKQMHRLSLGAVMGLNNEAVFEVLQILNEYGFIHLNRQLAPFTVTRRTSAEDLIPSLYS